VTVADLAGRAIVTLRRASAITSALERLSADGGERLQLALESGDPFLPRSLTALDGPPIEVRALEPAVGLPVALVWRRERTASPAARTFIDYVRRETALA
jgi:DNA-binding transcriptional LysR family regulator